MAGCSFHPYGDRRLQSSLQSSTLYFLSIGIPEKVVTVDRRTLCICPLRCIAVTRVLPFLNDEQSHFVHAKSVPLAGEGNQKLVALGADTWTSAFGTAAQERPGDLD